MTLGELFGRETKLPAGLDRVPIAGLAADSREVKPGYLFAALPGVKTDGARFIADALQRGAAAILVPQGARPVPTSAAIIEDSDPRRRLALIAARFFGLQPKTVVAVTGTNGKTSVASFVRQLWAGQGFEAASLGTVGVVSPSGTKILKHTTPDPIELHRILAALAEEGVTHLALEASSHGLQQRRVDGVALAAGAFTNISRDHLDYHPSFEDYFAQKLRLFTELLPQGAAAVVDVDSEAGRRVAAVAEARGLELVSVGRDGKTLRLVSAELDGFGQRLVIEHDGKRHSSAPAAGRRLPGLQCARRGRSCHGDRRERRDRAAAAWPSLHGARGRLDLAGTARGGRSDLHRLCAYARCARQGARRACVPMSRTGCIVVFGCGGDRDKGKRPEMGDVAVAKADLAIVTDDNPRSEDPAAIRSEILDAAPGAIEIGDRARAIAEAIGRLERGDVLLVAGKGHETGQTVGATVIPFSDHDAVDSRAEARGEMWLSRSGP